MATWTRIQPGFSIGVSPDNAYASELWHTDDLDANDVSASVLLNDPALPRLLSPHPDSDMKPALCTNKRLIRGPANLKATVLVEYSSIDPFASGPNRVAAAGQPSETTFYNWTFNSASRRYVYFEARFPRASITRVKTVALQGSPDQIANQIDPNVGRLYTLGGRNFLLNGYDLDGAATGIIVQVSYRFWATAPIRAMDAGTVPGQDIQVPALSTLDEWHPVQANPPRVSVRPATFTYERGARLPGL